MAFTYRSIPGIETTRRLGQGCAFDLRAIVSDSEFGILGDVEVYRVRIGEIATNVAAPHTAWLLAAGLLLAWLRARGKRGGMLMT